MLITTRLVIVAASLAAFAALTASSPAQPRQPQTLSFYPQAGVLWKDLYFGNFVDLDPGPGTLDWSCGHQTYDTHTGEDSILRTFREKRIGVPIFAVLDGTVSQIQDGFPDENTAQTATPFDNHVIVDSPGGEQEVYGHMIIHRMLPLREGDHVVAGQQIGLTGSSGNSSWPHLHFTYRFVDGPILEPFAGQCRPGPSYWAHQAPLPTEPYARGFVFSTEHFGGRRDPPWDEALRTGQYLAGARDVWFRVELGFFDGGPMRITFTRPDGTTARDVERPTNLEGYRAAWASWRERIDLDRPGTWRLRLSADGRTLVDAPFEVVASWRNLEDRPPLPVSVDVTPARPTPADVLQCITTAPLYGEDPDYAVPRYEYRWTIGGQTVRTVTSAALSDVLRHGLAHAGDTVRCTVTPSDGVLDGRAASATASVS